MSDLSVGGGARRDARLTRRSLIAAAGILATAGPPAASRALAFSSSRAPDFHAKGGSNFRGGNNPGPANGANCFLLGTRLSTPDGEIAIEKLSIGDLVVTQNGAARAIRWIGRMTIERCLGAPWPEDVQPVRVAAGAFGANVPHRDLYVSCAHMVHLGGVLIPVRDLINGRTIAVADIESEQQVYFHVVLDTHDVLLAEGEPCESLLISAETLPSFDNYAEYLALYGEPSAVYAAPCAPIMSFNGGRGELKSRLRSALAPVIDIRRPLDVVRDEIEARALLSKAA